MAAIFSYSSAYFSGYIIDGTDMDWFTGFITQTTCYLTMAAELSRMAYMHLTIVSKITMQVLQNHKAMAAECLFYR